MEAITETIPVAVILMEGLYWARSYGLMDEAGKLALIATVQFPNQVSYVIEWNQLRGDKEGYTVPARPTKLKHCKREVFPGL